MAVAVHLTNRNRNRNNLKNQNHQNLTKMTTRTLSPLSPTLQTLALTLTLTPTLKLEIIALFSLRIPVTLFKVVIPAILLRAVIIIHSLMLEICSSNVRVGCQCGDGSGCDPKTKPEPKPKPKPKPDSGCFGFGFAFGGGSGGSFPKILAASCAFVPFVFKPMAAASALRVAPSNNPSTSFSSIAATAETPSFRATCLARFLTLVLPQKFSKHR